ncbi:MAG: hypothetical protein RL095_274 [Verrucomicrobiota bacterium]|jgi:hypothetical protein
MARRSDRNSVLSLYFDLCRKTPWWVGLILAAAVTAFCKWALPAIFTPPADKANVAGGIFSSLAAALSSMSWLLGLILLAGWFFAQLKKPAVKGAIGEAITSTIHKVALDSKVYHQLNNVTLKLEDGSTTQIDHVIVSRFGIFVIETKNMAGWIFGKADQAQWTQTFPNGTKNSFQNPLRQNYRHLMALIEFYGLSKEDIDTNLFNLINFGPDATLKNAEELPPQVTMPHVAFIRSKQTEVFTPEQAAQMAQALQEGRMPNGLFKTQQTHEIHLASLQERHNSNSCPKCSKPLVERKRKSDGQAFLGCTGFPSCRYVRDETAFQKI